MTAIGDEISAIEEQTKDLETELCSLEMAFPNIPADSVPEGVDESANREERRWGTIPEFDFKPQAHWDLGPALGIIDFERAVTIAGGRFAVLRGAGAALERALTSYMLDLHTRAARLHRDAATGHRQHRLAGRNRAAAQVRRRSLPSRVDRFLSLTHRRGPTHESPPRRGSRRRAAPGEVLRLHPLFPGRGRLLRQGCPRSHPPPSVQQGRAGSVDASGSICCGSRRYSRAMPKPFSRASGWPIA